MVGRYEFKTVVFRGVFVDAFSTHGTKALALKDAELHEDCWTLVFTNPPVSAVR